MAYFIAVYIHVENGLARSYDPNMGRFQSMDPITDPDKAYSPAGLNAYQYGINNPLMYTDPYGEWFGVDDLIYAAAGAVVGAVNGLITYSQTGNAWDIGLGALSGAGSMWLNCNGIPAYYSLTTRGATVGVGYSFGGLINAGVSVSTDWKFQNFSVGGNVGLKLGESGISAGLNGSVNFNSNGITGGSAGIGLTFGVGNGMSVNAGVNAMFDKDGFSGAGISGGISQSFGDISGGASIGLNADRSGRISGSAGINGSYTGTRENEFGTQQMTYSENIGYGFNYNIQNGEWKNEFSGSYSASGYVLFETANVQSVADKVRAFTEYQENKWIRDDVAAFNDRQQLCWDKQDYEQIVFNVIERPEMVQIQPIDVQV